jgi:hypothetical protein
VRSGATDSWPLSLSRTAYCHQGAGRSLDNCAEEASYCSRGIVGGAEGVNESRAELRCAFLSFPHDAAFLARPPSTVKLSRIFSPGVAVILLAVTLSALSRASPPNLAVLSLLRVTRSTATRHGKGLHLYVNANLLCLSALGLHPACFGPERHKWDTDALSTPLGRL